jgi:hypothetical protein
MRSLNVEERMKAMILFGFVTMSCTGNTGKVIPAKPVQSEADRQHDIDAAAFDVPKPDAETPKVLVCKSPVMNSGKFSRVIVKENADGSRFFEVELTFEKDATENFTLQEPRIGEAAYKGVSEAVIVAYGLAPESRYQIALLDETVTVRIVGGRPVSSLDILGFPPASCEVLEADI